VGAPELFIQSSSALPSVPWPNYLCPRFALCAIALPSVPWPNYLCPRFALCALASTICALALPSVPWPNYLCPRFALLPDSDPRPRRRVTHGQGIGIVR